jgi:predicted amidohydrolase
MSLRIRAHQSSFSSNKEKNLSKILRLIEESDAYLDVFPEYDMGVPSHGLNNKFIQKTAETVRGTFVGKILEKTYQKNSAEVFTAYLREDTEVFNAAILAEKGEIRGVYKKIHLFDAFGYKESQIFSPGNELAVIKLKDFIIGLAICFDLRFPELFRAMAYRGVNLFIVPSGWYKGQYKIEQWQILTAARAHENISYLIAVNQADPFFIGHSILASPMGHVTKEVKGKETSLTLKIDYEKIEESKALLPIISLSKPKLYRRFYGWG